MLPMQTLQPALHKQTPQLQAQPALLTLPSVALILDRCGREPIADGHLIWAAESPSLPYRKRLEPQVTMAQMSSAI